MTGKHGAIGDGDVFAGSGVLTPLQVTTRFDGDAVVADADMAIGNMHIGTGFRIDTVGVGGIRIYDGQALDGEIIAKFRIYGPERRISDVQTFYQNVFAFVQLNKRRSEPMPGQGVFPVRLGFDTETGIGIQPGLLVFGRFGVLQFSLVERRFQSPGLFPPSPAVTFESSSALYSDVFGFVSINQRMKALHHHSLVTHFDVRHI